MKDYKSLFDKIVTWMPDVLKALETPLSKNANEIIEQMSRVEAYSATLTYYLENIREMINEVKPEYYPEKNPVPILEKMNMGEREMKMKSAMANFFKMEGLIAGIKDDIKQKLIVAEAILGYKKAELRSDRS